MKSASPLTAVIACSPSGVIGWQGGMPWKLKSDLQRFKSMTMGGTLVMGRKTFDSIGRPLPGRETIVLTRSPATTGSVPRLHWAQSLDQVLKLADELAKPVYIVGGAEIYRLFWPYCGEIWLTRVLQDVPGDTHVDLPLDEFCLLESAEYRQTDEDSAPTEFQRWVRKNPCQKLSCPIE